MALKICSVVFFSSLLVLHATEQREEAAAGMDPGERPAVTERKAPEKKETIQPSDSGSLRLFENYRKVIGAGGHPGIQNIRASGQFTYAKEAREFELVETDGGARHLVFQWRSMGRVYRERNQSVPGAGAAGRDVVSREISRQVIGRGGERTWERVFLELRVGSKLMHRQQFGTTVLSEGRSAPAKPLTAHQKEVIAGGYGEVSPEHFRQVFLMRQPLLDPDKLGMGYRYGGVEKRFGRPVYIVRQFSGGHFYFDQKKFLLVQWGGKSHLGGKNLPVDYRSTRFKRQGQILLPAKVLLTAEGTVLGTYEVEQVEVNAAVAPDFFAIPE